MSRTGRLARALSFGALASACASPPSVRVVRSTDVEFPPKRSALEVEILRAPPEGPYLEIAVLSAGGGFHQTTEEVVAKMREHAALLGADALVLTRETYRDEGAFRVGPSRAELYGLPGPPATIRDEPDPARLRAPQVEAIAVRYAARGSSA